MSDNKLTFRELRQVQGIRCAFEQFLDEHELIACIDGDGAFVLVQESHADEKVIVAAVIGTEIYED